MRRETGCDAVMIGRHAVGNPWLFRDALAWLATEEPPPEPPPPVTLADRLTMLIEHARLMVRHRGEPRGAVEFRKHATHYLHGVRASRSLKQALMSCATLGEIEQAVADFRQRHAWHAASESPASEGRRSDL